MFSSFLEDKLDPCFSPYCDKHKTWQKTVKASNLTKKNFESCARKKIICKTKIYMLHGDLDPLLICVTHNL